MKTPTYLLVSIAAFTLAAFHPDLRGQTMPILTTLHSFTGTGTDGASPDAGLVQGSDGNFYGTTYVGGSGDNAGTVFKMTPAGVLTTLHSFTDNGTDGAYPNAALVRGSNGDFYGTTSYGGYGYGTVFRITPAGVLTTLHSFTDSGTDGAYPEAGLLQGSDGNFYGTTSGNPDSDASGRYGTVFRITPAGVLTTLHSFTDSSTDGGFPYAGLVQGSDGNFYGTTVQGGPEVVGTVFRMTPAGVLTILYSFTGDATGYYPYAGLVQGSDGNFYGTTYVGGSASYGTVFRMTPAGVLTTLHSFTDSGTDGAYPNAALVRGSDGNFYGTTSYGGPDYGTVFRMTPAGVLTTLHSFTDSGTDGGSPYAAPVQGSDGNFYGTTHAGGVNGGGVVFRLNVIPVITSATEATATVGHAFSYQIIATNDPTDYAATGLPAGLSVNTGTGLISGTPQKAGTYTLMLSASNLFGQGTATLTLTVAAAGTPYITSALTLEAADNAGISYQITATGNPTRYGVQGLPGGLSVNARTGLISGTAKYQGTFRLTLNAYNGVGKGSAILTLTVQPTGPPAVTSATTASGKLGAAFSYQITATNQPTIYGVYGLPGGLTIDAQTGLLSGAPKFVGTFQMTLNTYNSLGKGSETFTLTVSPD